MTFLSKTVYTQTLTLNTDGITYGSGQYIIYSSSVFTSGDQNILRKRDIFNFATEETGGHWDSCYTASGNYTLLNFIKNDYNGDWIIIKLPNPIILTKFKFFHRTSFVSQAPSLWRCYGSNDGVNFTEITEAFNDVIANALVASSYNINKMYEKVLNDTFKTFYQYIGFTFNKTVSNQYLCFCELQLFGKENNNFQSDWNSTIINKPDLSVYATNTNLNNASTLINNLNSTSTTTFNNLNSLSTNSILNINNLNSTSTSTLII